MCLMKGVKSSGGERQRELMRVDRLERLRSYEKMIEGGLLGGSEGRDRWREGGRKGRGDSKTRNRQ